MTYFGLLKDLDLNSMTIKELRRIHLTKGLFHQVRRIPLSLNGSPNPVTSENSEPVYVPNAALTKEFYGYILDVYEDVIENSLIGFFYSYEEDILGLDAEEKRKVALRYYKEIVKSAIEDRFDILRNGKSPDGHTKISRAKKLELFGIRQEVLQERLTTENQIPLSYFLIGDATYFDDSLVYKIPILEEVLRFEASLKILLILNEEFQFEGDEYLTTHEKTRNFDDKTGPKKTKKKKTPLISDDEAIAFLIDTVFSKPSK
ncbi:hypothetical protein [Zobellia alginiliquefaciens]|uniref:hypothetical protein n=1 Tax=Zobellia alginiliquefaciens TaxID=3032586 RepID=UPI0023E0CB92|nr:hypothetical protein [Zobellia alginiliquefaciens]